KSWTPWTGGVQTVGWVANPGSGVGAIGSRPLLIAPALATDVAVASRVTFRLNVLLTAAELATAVATLVVELVVDFASTELVSISVCREDWNALTRVRRS